MHTGLLIHSEFQNGVCSQVIYTTFAVAIAIFTGIRTYMMFVIGLKSSSNLHLRLLGSVLAAPLSWFDVTPTGRIVNRFSQDVYTMDESLPHQWSMFINTIMSVVFVMLSMIFVMYWYVCRNHIHTATFVFRCFDGARDLTHV